MPTNAFAGRAQPPSDADLSEALGASRALWDQIIEALTSDGSITNHEWHSYSVKAGWSMRLQRKGRNIVYLGPRAGMFVAAFVFGDKAIAVIRAGKFPKSVLGLLDDAKKYPEGTPLRLEVKRAADVETIRRLAAIKVAN